MTTVKESPTGPNLSPPPYSAEDKGLRCEFTFSDGRQCRSQRAQFCAHHASRKRRGYGDEVAPDPALQGLCSDLTTATNINRALAQVFLLMAQGRISQKQAVAFGYLSQLLLQTVPGIRSEFVSAFGYQPWQENLTMKLKSSGSAAKVYPPAGESLLAANVYQPRRNVYQQDELSPQHKVELRGVKKEHQELSTVQGVAEPNDESADPTGAVILSEPSSGERLPTGCAFAGQQSQRRISPEDTLDQEIPPEPAPVNKAHLSAQSLQEGLTPEDWDSLYHRGRDLLAGKYSVTPEGRREAQALDTDLELIKPPVAKMPKGARASVIEHMKRWIAQKKTPIRSGSASRPPAKVYPPAGESLLAANVYQPRRNVYQQDELSPQHKVELSPVNKDNQSEGPLRSSAPPPLNMLRHPAPVAVQCAELDRAAHSASSIRSAENSPSTDKLSPPPKSVTPSSRPEAVSPDPPPTHRPKKKRASAQVPAPEPSQRPIPAPLAPELEPDISNRTAHATGWYAPPDWARNRKPDPFPTGEEKRQRELRGMSNSKLRHLQHLNSRAF